MAKRGPCSSCSFSQAEGDGVRWLGLQDIHAIDSPLSCRTTPSKSWMAGLLSTLTPRLLASSCRATTSNSICVLTRAASLASSAALEEELKREKVVLLRFRS